MIKGGQHAPDLCPTGQSGGGSTYWFFVIFGEVLTKSEHLKLPS